MIHFGVHRLAVPIGVLLLAAMAMPLAAQTPASVDRSSGGRRPPVPATQRDIVTASNADAFLFTDEYPRADVVFASGDLTCYRLIETRDYERPKTATVGITWCLNARNGLVTAASENWAFPDEITVQGAFCGWDSTLGETHTDTITCKVLIQEAQRGPPKASCVNEELNWALHGDGTWERLAEWDIKPYSYEAAKPYPLSD